LKLSEIEVFKPGNTRCVQFDGEDRCRIFGDPGRPAVCASLQPSLDMCGQSRTEALLFLSELDRLTVPQRIWSNR
jgi:hypothetical protein